MEDAMTLYSDLISDWDTPVKIPSFGTKPKLPTSSAQVPVNTVKFNLITQTSINRPSDSSRASQSLLANIQSPEEK